MVKGNVGVSCEGGGCEVFIDVDVVAASREASTVISLIDKSIDLGLGLDKIAVVSCFDSDKSYGFGFEGFQQSISVDMKCLAIGGTESLAIYVVEDVTSSGSMSDNRNRKTSRIHSVLS